MPSRKRREGKARKTKGRQQDELVKVEDVIRLNHFSCDHGMPPVSADGDIVGRFLVLFLTVLEDSFQNHNPIGQILDVFDSKAPDLCVVWGDATLRKRMQKHLVSLGVDCILRSEDRKAAAIALATITFEMQPCVEAGAKMLNLNDGNTRETVKFFAKRITCDCLKQKCKDLKSQPKVGVCFCCKEKKERKQLLVCSSCRVRQYCSKGMPFFCTFFWPVPSLLLSQSSLDCQRKDWPSHKASCVDMRSIMTLCADEECCKN